jgi:hypothetical protein
MESYAVKKAMKFACGTVQLLKEKYVSTVDSIFLHILLYFVLQVPFGPNNSVLVAFGVEKVQVGGILLSKNDRVRAGVSTTDKLVPVL